jgi:hypothetical protein
VWNLAVEQHAWWRPGRDFARAMAGLFAGTRGRPSWRKAGRDEGFRVTGQRGRQWGAVPGSDGEAKTRLGDYLAEVLLLDQGADAARARDELGWDPSHPSLTEEFRQGSYRG